MLLIGFWGSGSVCLLLFTLTLLPLLRCPFVDFFGSLASRGFPSYLSLPSEGRDAFGGSRDANGASQGFSSPSARLGPAGGVEEPLVVRSVRASSLLSLQFIRGLGILELLSCGELLLLFMSDWLSLLISVRSTR